MAVELYSDNNSSVISPRISFSHDLILSDIVPVEQHHHPVRSALSPGSSIDFDFCTVRKSVDQDSYSADELFSDGKLLPTEIKRKMKDSVKEAADQSSSTPPIASLSETMSAKETKSTSCDEEGTEEINNKQSSKSFWRFKRSSSLNCGSGYGRSLCPLPLLSRSNSTGSTPNVKKASSLSREYHVSHKHKQAGNFVKPSSVSYQKPPLKKNYGPYGNGVRVSPVLNVSSGNLFGFVSIFSNGTKDKTKKK